MCKAFLCEIYRQELKGTHKRLSTLRQQKRWGHWPETIDLEIEVAQQCVSAAKAKIDELHMQVANEMTVFNCKSTKQALMSGKEVSAMAEATPSTMGWQRALEVNYGDFAYGPDGRMIQHQDDDTYTVTSGNLQAACAGKMDEVQRSGLYLEDVPEALEELGMSEIGWSYE